MAPYSPSYTTPTEEFKNEGMSNNHLVRFSCPLCKGK